MHSLSNRSRKCIIKCTKNAKKQYYLKVKRLIVTDNPGLRLIISWWGTLKESEILPIDWTKNINNFDIGLTRMEFIIR